MRDIFISYVRENEKEIRFIYDSLMKFGISCWLDKEDLSPGEYWPTSIAEAIQSGTYFLACFSRESEAKTRSHMREEIYIAIEAGKLLPLNQTWIIPIRLSECTIPALDLGGGRKLNKLQYVDIFNNNENGIATLAKCIKKLKDIQNKSEDNYASVKDIPIETMRLNEFSFPDQRKDFLLQLIGGIAHDFKNILAVISGYSSLIIKLSTDDKIKGFADNILVANDQANKLAKSILQFSQKKKEEELIFDVKSIILDVIKDFQHILPKNLKLFKEIEYNSFNIKGDPNRIHQCILNLFVNARDSFLDNNNGKIFIRLKKDSDPSWCIIEIEDTGTGIQKDILDKIFNPFFTTKKNSTGLGLPVTYDIVKSHGGFIGVESQIEKGSKFQIKLPIIGIHNNNK